MKLILIKRFLALVIDMAIVGLLFTVLYDLLGFEIPFYFNYILILFKDLTFSTGSLGKKFLNLKIILNNSKQVASRIMILVRNVFLFIWPIDLIILLIFKRRIGDILFKIDVVSSAPDPVGQN